MKQAPGPALQAYGSLVRRKQLVLLVAAVACFLAALLAIHVGSYRLPISDILRSFIGRASAQAQLIIMNIRLPRAAAAIVVGATLAASGAVMQCVLQNPLAAASTLGVSQGAAFGAALGIIVFGGGVVNSDSAAVAVSINNPYIVTFSAFVAGSMSSLVVILLAQLKPDMGPGALILAGVAISSLFGGGSALLQYFADESKISTVVFWTFGNLGSASWREIAILSLAFLLSFVYFLFNRWNYNAMESGADTAHSLGVNTRAVMLVSMGVCSLVSAVAVSFVGIISFVGLVAPHMMRRFVGNDYRYLVPGSAIAGALLLLLADSLARWVISPVVLPIGAITSFLGAPLFLYLLFRGLKDHG